MVMILWGVIILVLWLHFEFKEIYDELKEIKKILTKK